MLFLRLVWLRGTGVSAVFSFWGLVKVDRRWGVERDTRGRCRVRRERVIMFFSFLEFWKGGWGKGWGRVGGLLGGESPASLSRWLKGCIASECGLLGQDGWDGRFEMRSREGGVVVGLFTIFYMNHFFKEKNKSNYRWTMYNAT